MKFAIYVKGDRGIQSLDGLQARSLIPSVCVSEKDDPAIAAFCEKSQIPYTVENRPKQQAHIEFLRDQELDLLVCAGYSKILPGELFEHLPHGAINCHGGRLPEYRGASPIPWQIINGESYGIANILRMTEGIDDGPILAQGRYEIEEHDTARSVTDKVSAIFRQIVPDVVECYARGEIPAGTPQDEKYACHWTRRYPEDGLIPWDKLTVRQVVNLIRALDDPYPGAFIVREGQRIVLRRARIFDHQMAGVPGRCVGKTPEGALILALDGAVEILEFVQNGKLFSGDKFPARYGETF